MGVEAGKWQRERERERKRADRCLDIRTERPKKARATKRGPSYRIHT